MNDRTGNFAFLPIKTMKMGTCSSDYLKRVLENIDFSGKTIITDSGTDICNFVKGLTENDETITHKSFVSANVKKGLIIDNIHNNNINNVMMLYEKFQNVFKDNSTKYQWNYLTWFKLTRFFKEKIKGLPTVIKESVSLGESNIYNQFKGMFNTYKGFATA